MSNEMTEQRPNLQAAEMALVSGDLSKLTAEQRLSYYRQVCESLGLNPLTKPFDYLNLNGKLRLYACKDCTDQLRKRDKISIVITGRELVEGVYTVTAKARTPDGREDEEIGAVPVANLKGDALANAMMKCSTKAKRRVTLSICGLGMLDESEVETIASATLHHEPALPPPKEEPKQPAKTGVVEQAATELALAQEDWRKRIKELADETDFNDAKKDVEAIKDKAFQKEIAGWLRARANQCGIVFDKKQDRYVKASAA